LHLSDGYIGVTNRWKWPDSSTSVRQWHKTAWGYCTVSTLDNCRTIAVFLENFIRAS